MAAIDDARDYINARFGPTYRAWELLTEDDQERTLVSARDVIDRQPWQGTATHLVGDPPVATDLAWPRSGVVVDGVPVDSTTVPDDIIEAEFELAVSIAAKPGIVNQVDQGSNVKRVGGGGAPEVEFFSPTSARTGTATTLPLIVQQLVGKYLATPGAAADGGFAGVGGTCSSFSPSQRFDLVLPE